MYILFLWLSTLIIKTLYLYLTQLLLFCVTSVSLFLNLSFSFFSLISAPSLRLAYKDIEQQRKLEEQKLKGLDGKKKEQAERLGMGLGIRRYNGEQVHSSHPIDG